MRGLISMVEDTREFKNLLQGLKKGFRQQLVFGLGGSQKSLVMSALIEQVPGPVLVVTTGELEAGALVDDLTALLPEEHVCHFPVYELLPYQVLAHDREVLLKRLRVLEKLGRGERLVVVAPVEALMRRLSPPAVFSGCVLRLAVGERRDPGELSRRLAALGYERVDLVEAAGQYGLRGGILDVFPATMDSPVRIEFFDDEVDSIRLFNAVTQRSEMGIDRVTIAPAQELVVSEDDWDRAGRNVDAEFRVQLKKLARNGTPDAGRQLREFITEVLEYFKQKAYFPGVEQFLPYFYQEQVTLLDYLPPGSLLLVDEPVRARELVDSIQKERSETYSDLLAKGKVLPGQFQGYADWNVLQARMEKMQGIYWSLLPRQARHLQPQNVVNFTAKSMHGFFGRTEMLAEEVRQWRDGGNAVVLLVSAPERADFLLGALSEKNVVAARAGSLDRPLQPGQVVVACGHLTGGFELVGARLVVITEQEIFARRKKPGRGRKRQETRLETFSELKKGDYVVHVNHGIGRYMGIVPLTIGGIRKEYLLLKYAGEDKLYVPIDQVGLLQKYVGGEAEAPKLSRLGGTEWARVKGRVREAVKEMAQELLALYAARETVAGHAFSPDTVWQLEFEAAFPYEETPDQLRAIEEVKRDMERPRPMDRLLCGDVGYGKTEVALRAAFKAVMDGKQVAVLVPTTILAQQHFNTFRERFAGYPVRIEMLSRFRSQREQKQIIDELKSGRIDIVIGTHRLVQDDVVFKDLGLVVVDEEQRFGVAHKERLKQLRTSVDVLTLTATPIPRTLHMSLIGVRDTSLLETPPENRFPVQTYVVEEDPVLIREAIRKEMARGGQVFFVHNRVAELDRVASWLQELVPEARLAVAHGQMREEELEQVMMNFINGEYDILVCTTIIESGLDIPNVNTLIVKDANNLGLSQLYQLRGRVGRSNRLAYAYFTFRKDRVLSEVAEKRMAAIREFTEFGSGYKIAMRDLEIRGAGNLLGPEQHGHIAAVGFDLYCRLLEEAVREARGEPLEQPVETVVEVPVEAYIPDEYVPDADQKVELYRRLASLNRLEGVNDLEEELADRFGALPEPVQNLLGVVRLKVMATALKIRNITWQNGFCRFQFAPEHALTGDKLVEVGKEYGGRVKFNMSNGDFEIRLRVRDAGKTPGEILSELQGFLQFLE